MLRDPPEVVLGRHPAPVAAIEAGQIDRTRIGAQGAPLAWHQAEMATHLVPPRAFPRTAAHPSITDTDVCRAGDGVHACPTPSGRPIGCQNANSLNDEGLRNGTRLARRPTSMSD